MPNADGVEERAKSPATPARRSKAAAAGVSVATMLTLAGVMAAAEDPATRRDSGLPSFRCSESLDDVSAEAWSEQAQDVGPCTWSGAS